MEHHQTLFLLALIFLERLLPVSVLFVQMVQKNLYQLVLLFLLVVLIHLNLQLVVQVLLNFVV
jgi:hypothetical protein